MDKNNEVSEMDTLLMKLGLNIKSKEYKRYFKAGLLKNIDKVFVEEVQDYWLENYGMKVGPYLHLANMNLTGDKKGSSSFWDM